MLDEVTLRTNIQQLRENADLSQAELAKRIGVAASRISRLESGELSIDTQTASDIAKAIGSPEAFEFVAYLESVWLELEQPTFNHPSLAILLQSEHALRQLKLLTDDPDVKNSFLKQVESCDRSLKQIANQLQSTEHPVVYIGKPGVGKTTAICSEGQLRNMSEKTLAKRMIFQTGSGRSTVGEVCVRYGADWTLNVTPCSMADLKQYIKDLADGIISSAATDTSKPTSDSQVSNSAEVDRLLRNMTGLSKNRKVQTDGTYKVIDPAIDLNDSCDDREQLVTRLWERLDLPKRRRTSISRPQGSKEPGFAWVAKTFKAINMGNHLEFSLPERIEVTVPVSVLGCEKYNITLVDTRGIDEPTAPRRDLQSYMDDERTLLVLCSDFVSAPDAAVQSLIDRGMKSGCEEILLQRSSILVVTKDKEDERMFDDTTGDEVKEKEIGRAIRRDQMKSTTLKDLGLAEIPVRFLDVCDEGDCEASRKFIIEQLEELRKRWETKAKLLSTTVEQINLNKANEQMKEAMETAFTPIIESLEINKRIASERGDFHSQLIGDINAVRYASSLRASVNRRGDWQRFNYWSGLGSSARQLLKTRLNEQVTKLRGVIETQVASSDGKPFGSFLVHFEELFEKKIAEFYIWIGQVGETTFYEKFHSDDEYWHKTQERWGGGKGYKEDISCWTDDWFAQTTPRDKADSLDAEIQLKWKHLVEELQDVLNSPSVDSVT